MDAIFSSSRGRHLADPLSKLHPSPSSLQVISQGGGSLERLQHSAYRFLQTTPDPTNSHVYFVAGLCDISRINRSEDRYSMRYEEVTYWETPSETIQRVNALVDQISSNILFMGAKPCFATILPSSLQTWNQHRLDNNNTNLLLFTDLYDTMQENMNKSIFEINKHITALNYSNDMATPFLANTIIEHRGMKAPKVFLNRLPDGVHPPTQQPRILINKLAKRLFNSIRINRKLDTPIDFDQEISSISDVEYY